jgi:hypothetical protein
MRAGHLELSATTPRDVRLTGAGTALIATAVALVVGAMASALVLFLAYTQSEERRELREREKRGIDAQVVTVTRSGGDGRRRLVSYQFEVDGRSYTGRARLRDRDRRPVAQGARLSIEYLPSQPEESWIVGYEAKRFPLWTIPLVPISLLVLAVVAAARVRRQWTLLSEGRVAHARVTAHKRIHIGDHRGYRVNAEFRDLSGAMHMARYVSRTTPPPAGTVLPIVYHRDNPKWSAFYPLRLVRPTRGFEKVAEPPRPSRYLPAPKARRRSRGGERSH